MGDQDTGEEFIDTETGEEGAGEEDPSDDGAGAEGEDPGEGEPEGAGDGAEGEDKAEDNDEEPPKRATRTPADWVALRRGRKLEKVQKSTQGEDGGANKTGAEGEDDITRKVKEVLGTALEPLIVQQEQQEIAQEISQFVSDNPDFQPYADKVARWSQDSSWKDVPIDRIFYAVAGKDLLRIGATRKAEADRKAAETRTGGGGGADTGTKQWNEVPLEDVGKEIERIKLQR